VEAEPSVAYDHLNHLLAYLEVASLSVGPVEEYS
jgi:hypothetical protein